MTQPFAAQDAVPLFPTLLWRADLKPEDFTPLNTDLRAVLPGLGAPAEALRSGENWQSPHDLHRHPAFEPLLAKIHQATGAMLDYLRVSEELLITGCWVNINAPGTGHRVHSHRNNFISGTYYVQVQEGADTINFFDPRYQAGVIRPRAKEPTAENSEMAMIHVQTGSLLLFPSWLLHAVDPNRSKQMRISISFNMMFPAFAETMAKPGWTPDRGRPS